MPQRPARSSTSSMRGAEHDSPGHQRSGGPHIGVFAGWRGCATEACPIDGPTVLMLPAAVMKTVSSLGRSKAFNLANMLTYGRLVAVPVVVGLLFWPEDHWSRWFALIVFALAAITDYLDGYVARTYGQQSVLGRMLDPIADKLLVAACLLMLVYTRTIDGVAVWAAIVILCREILVSGLREFLAELKVSVPVSRVAK